MVMKCHYIQTKYTSEDTYVYIVLGVLQEEMEEIRGILCMIRGDKPNASLQQRDRLFSGKSDSDIECPNLWLNEHTRQTGEGNI